MDETRPAQGKSEQQDAAAETKHEWQDPKMTFIEPKISDQGGLVEITGQFLGGFSPDGQ